MGQRLHSPQYWRSCVEQTLTIANQMCDPECKRLLIGIAQAYAQLARLAVHRGESYGSVGGRTGRMDRKP